MIELLGLTPLSLPAALYIYIRRLKRKITSVRGCVPKISHLLAEYCLIDIPYPFVLCILLPMPYASHPRGEAHFNDMRSPRP